MSKIKKAPRRKTIKRKKDFRASAMLMMIVVIFCMFSSILVFQRNSINALDSEINQLEHEYEQAVRLNEDLQGELLGAKNLHEIETYAIDTLGMVQGGHDNIAYVSYNNASTQIANNQNNETLFSWVSGLFR